MSCLGLKLRSSSFVIGPLGYGGNGQSPWLWLIIIGGGVCFYVWGRVRGWPQARGWSNVGDRLFLIGEPWWLQALFLAIVGGGSLFHIATGTTGGTGGSYRLSLGSRLPKWS